MSADGHMRAWVRAARSNVIAGNTKAAVIALDKALAGPCGGPTAVVSDECARCGERVHTRFNVWVHVNPAHDNHPATPQMTCNDTDRPDGLDPATLDHRDLFTRED